MANGIEPVCSGDDRGVKHLRHICYEAEFGCPRHTNQERKRRPRGLNGHRETLAVYTCTVSWAGGAFGDHGARASSTIEQAFPLRLGSPSEPCVRTLDGPCRSPPERRKATASCSVHTYNTLYVLNRTPYRTLGHICPSSVGEKIDHGDGKSRHRAKQSSRHSPALG